MKLNLTDAIATAVRVTLSAKIPITIVSKRLFEKSKIQDFRELA